MVGRYFDGVLPSRPTTDRPSSARGTEVSIALSPLRRSRKLVRERLLGRSVVGRLGSTPSKVPADHRGDPAGQVAQAVRQFGGVDRVQVLPGERAVRAELDRPEEVVPERVGAEVVGDLVRRDRGQLRLLIFSRRPAASRARRPASVLRLRAISMAGQITAWNRRCPCRPGARRPARLLEPLRVGAVAAAVTLVQQRVDPRRGRGPRPGHRDPQSKVTG